MAPTAAPTIKPPSKILYLFWGYFALTSDILSIVGDLGDLTGIGLILVTLIELAIQAGFLTTGYLATGKIRKLQQATLSHEQEITRAQNVIQQYRQGYARALRAGRKVKALRAPLRALSTKKSKFSKINPFKRFALTAAAEIVPIFNALPWQLYGVYHMYKSHKTAYQEALEFREESILAQQEEEAELAQTQQFQEEEEIAA